MTAFKFRLASVLRFRERVKQEKRWELDALIAAQRRMEDEIHTLEHELLRAGEALVGREGQVVAGRELRLHGDYAHRVAQRIREKRAALEKFQEELAAKRLEVVEAMRAVKVLEQLRERLEVKFRREQNIEEQKFTDEIGQRKFADPETRKKMPR